MTGKPEVANIMVMVTAEQLKGESEVPCTACAGKGRVRMGSAEKVQQARLGAGMKPAELARRLGVSRAYVFDLENGRRPLRDEMLARIAEALSAGSPVDHGQEKGPSEEGPKTA